MTHESLNDYLLSYANARLEYPFGPEAAVYKVGQGDDAKIFAIIAEGSDPVRISLKCDPQLAQLLREKYESVQPGYHLNKKHWNTVVCTGQLGDGEIKDLIRLSYDLVAKVGS